MSDDSVDPRWADVLSLAAHEMRNPLGAASGYLRMLLTGRMGDVSDRQRRLLEDAAKVCGRMSTLLDQLSTLSDLEDGTATFNRATLNIQRVLNQSIAALPDDPDRTVALDMAPNGAGTLQGDATRLTDALSAVIHAVRRELVSSHRLCVRAGARTVDGRRVEWIAIGDPERVDWLSKAAPSTLTTFDEWRGGCGLSLPIARRVVEGHGGRIWSPPAGDGGDAGTGSGRAGAVIALPLA